MKLSEKDKLEAQLILEELETEQTALGVYLAKAIKDSAKIPEELKESFIDFFGKKEAELAHGKANNKLGRYDSRTLTLRKHWWSHRLFW